MLLIVMYTLLCLLSCSVESCAVKRKSHWVIVFKCWDTKIVMNLFEFSMNDRHILELRQSLSYNRTMVLSRFNPESETDKAVLDQGFTMLFQKADMSITCAKERTITPVFLYTTFGFRSLPKVRAEKLLALCRATIKKSHYDKRFAEKGMKRVAMITGAMEGVYAWLAVNYLTSPNLNKQRADSDYGVLYHSLSSTAITFRPNDFNLLDKANVTRSTLNSPLWQIPNPSLGPGIFSKASRGYITTMMKLFGAFDDCKVSSTGCPKNKTYKSQCLHPKFKGTFIFGSFKVEGMQLQNPYERYFVCQKQASQLLQKYLADSTISVEDIRKLFGKDTTTFFSLIGYYYACKTMDRLNPLTPAGSKCNGFKLTVDEFIEGTKLICKYPLNERHPFTPYKCMQASYLSVLLTEGYGLPSNTTLYACKDLNAQFGTETRKVKADWPLGVALQAANWILEPIF